MPEILVWDNCAKANSEFTIFRGEKQMHVNVQSVQSLYKPWDKWAFCPNGLKMDNSFPGGQ